MIYVLSTPVIPPGVEGPIDVFVSTLAEVRTEIDEAKGYGEPVESYCSHLATCKFLGVPVDTARRTLTATTMVRPCALVGLRPLVRPEPGKELEINDQTFQGFHLGIPR